MLGRLSVFAVPLLLLAASACGGDNNDSDSPTTTTGETPEATASNKSPTESPDGTDDEGEDSQPPASDGDGVIELNGERINVNEVRRCEPFSDSEGNLDLTAIGEGVMLFVVVNEGTVLSHELSLQGSSAGGVFSATANQFSDGSWTDEDGQPISGAPFTVGEDRISGSMTLNDARGGADTADVSFELPIPSEIIDCSL